VKALVIAGSNLRRILRDRANIFFLFILPMMIILLIGAAFGGESARLGTVSTGSGLLGEQLVEGLDRQPNLEVDRFGNEPDLRHAVERGRVQAGLVVPADYDASVRSGKSVALPYFARPDSIAQELRLTVEAVVAEQAGVIRAARLLEREGLAEGPAAFEQAAQAAAQAPRVPVRVTETSGDPYEETGGRFDLSASTQLLLFIFLTSLTGASALIESRRLGVSRRMLSTPTSSRTILLGEALGRLAIAVTQALLIIVGSIVMFGVDWGDPLAAIVLVLAFCLVGSGAGMLLGSALTNEEQATAVSLLLGLGLAALGGSMVPLEVFPETMRTIAHLTPHAWGNDGFSELLRHGGGLADVTTDVGVLLAWAAALLAIATWRLRRSLTT
jgi:linearmycin/streptolysin S transport system permease protein